LRFKSGPETGKTSLAIFELDGDTWRLCLTVTATTRPTSFATASGSGLALETLRRQIGPSARDLLRDELSRLEGTWTMLSGVRDGQQLPDAFARTGKRLVKGNETTVLFGSDASLKAAVHRGPDGLAEDDRLHPDRRRGRGRAQLGIYALEKDTVTYCMAPPGRPRPAEFTHKDGAGGTTTVWKRKTK